MLGSGSGRGRHAAEIELTLVGFADEGIMRAAAAAGSDGGARRQGRRGAAAVAGGGWMSAASRLSPVLVAPASIVLEPN